MRRVAAAGREVLGLFIDDGRFALAILAWLAIMALVSALAPLPGPMRGPLLFAGLAAILAVSCRRAIALRR
jgi:hypothetical protein